MSTDSFDVTCQCGVVYHTDTAHIGQQIRCRCGARVTVYPPSDIGDVSETRSAPGDRPTSGSRRRRRTTVGPESAHARFLQEQLDADRWWIRLRRWRPGQSFAGARTFGRAQTHATRRVARIAEWGAVAWTGALALWWLVWRVTAETFLPSALFTFGPRWVVLLPAAVLVPLALWTSRRALGVLAVGLCIAAWPLLGLRVAVPPAGLSAPPAAAAGALRVLSLNVLGGAAVLERLDDIRARYAPDLLALQECGPAIAEALEARRDWHVVRVGRLCSVSRWPLTFLDTMPRAAFARVAAYGAGGTGQVLRVQVAHPAGPFTFVNVHLETARKGLEGLVSSQGILDDDGLGLATSPVPSAGGAARAELNAMVRERESERAAMWSARHAEREPVLVAGDFNMPVESAIYRAHWSALTNAFDARGTGFGYTKRDGRWLRVRIDHVLAAPRWFAVSGAWLGEDVGSDHLPMVADVTRRQP
ncbi:MAG: endonuclease/exonuclease/phosphatase family protein [Gemmatimonadetes bacterium]|nr:endonuclease/exonuclease/phosphatase family protein [Gemmatimonadota bacterium]